MPDSSHSKNDHKYSFPGEWIAFFAYLCVDAEKAWERGLAGAFVAEQICQNLGIKYNREVFIESLPGIRFHRMEIAANSREINELNKFFIWKRGNTSFQSFCFTDDDGTEKALDEGMLRKLGQCLDEWNFPQSVIKLWKDN